MATRTLPRVGRLQHCWQVSSPSSVRHAQSLACTSHSYSTTTLRISSNSNRTHIEDTLRSLLPPTGSWHLTSTGNGLERAFTFRTFKAAWSFMTHVATHASKNRHHPEWSNIYNRVFVRWTTHNPPGLSTKDVDGAMACEEFAVKVQGESGAKVGDGDVTGDGGDVRGLVEEVRQGGKEGQGKAEEEK